MGKEERLERMEPPFEGNPEALKVEEMQERPAKRQAKRQAKGMTGRLQEIAESEGKEELLSMKGFTEADIAHLINEACERASIAQGSALGKDSGYSQNEADLNSTFGERELQNEFEGSQKFHTGVAGSISKHFVEFEGTCTVASLGGMVNEALALLEEPICRPWSSTSSKEIFPLPVTGLPSRCQTKGLFLQAMIRSLNSLYGVPTSSTVEKTSPAGCEVLKRLAGVVEGSALLDTELPDLY